MAIDVILLKLEVSRLGVTRRVAGEDLAEVTGGKTLSPEFFRATKKLWSCEEFDAINSACNKARAVVDSMAVPAPFIGRGFVLVATKRWNAVDAALQDVRAEVATAVAAFGRVFEERVATSQAELAREGIPFALSEYPSWEEVRDAFRVDWRPMEMGVPVSLQQVSAQAYAEAKIEAEARWASALEDVDRLLAAELKNLLDRMVERLTDEVDPETGVAKKRIFRDSLVENVREFIMNAPFRNISCNGELDDLCKEIGRILANETADSLRASPGMREMVRDRMAVVATTLEAAVVRAPSRKIVVLDDRRTAAGE